MLKKHIRKGALYAYNTSFARQVSSFSEVQGKRFSILK
jgi:hypothetical protein